MVVCNETKEKCIGFSVSELVKAGTMKATENQCKAIVAEIACVQAGCNKKHQAVFLHSASKLPKNGPINLKAKGEDKNAKLRWAVLLRRSSFTEDQLTAVARGKFIIYIILRKLSLIDGVGAGLGI